MTHHPKTDPPKEKAEEREHSGGRNRQQVALLNWSGLRERAEGYSQRKVNSMAENILLNELSKLESSLAEKDVEVGKLYRTLTAINDALSEFGIPIMETHNDVYTITERVAMLVASLTAARAAAREECARVANDKAAQAARQMDAVMGTGCRRDYWEGGAYIAKEIAAAIRNLSDGGEGEGEKE